MKDPRVDLAQILECAQRILSYTVSGKDVFLEQSLISAVEA